ncbi:hypothetical protein scyTo_0022732 [Scyliorhinus torazame]|uniref:Uncharacterized protein n=1 Tax=Scyliorhinus torazame TaxID=75743 RepID=A0A401Q6A9_SCYTO|nr:hypothetical protein [Scyliorhinus torazame]
MNVQARPCEWARGGASRELCLLKSFQRVKGLFGNGPEPGWSTACELFRRARMKSEGILKTVLLWNWRSLDRMHSVVSYSVSLGSLGLMKLFGISWTWSFAASFGIYLGSGGWRFIRIVLKTAPRDLFCYHGLFDHDSFRYTHLELAAPEIRFQILQTKRAE